MRKRQVRGSEFVHRFPIRSKRGFKFSFAELVLEIEPQEVAVMSLAIESLGLRRVHQTSQAGAPVCVRVSCRASGQLLRLRTSLVVQMSAMVHTKDPCNIIFNVVSTVRCGGQFMSNGERRSTCDENCSCGLTCFASILQ